jgi:hypothetical protein
MTHHSTVALPGNPDMSQYLSTLDKSTKQNARDTVEFAKVLRDSIQNFSLRLPRDEAELQDTQVAIEKQVRYSTAIREIEMAMLEMKFSLIQLQESLGTVGISLIHSCASLIR